MRVILTAAGAMRRWTVDGELYGGVPKHLIPIDGEPLIHRTVRILRDRGVTDIWVVAPPDPRYVTDGAQTHVPDHHVPWAGGSTRHDCDKFLSSRELWDQHGRTVIVHGDVYLAEDAADRIIGHQAESWCLFARYRRFNRPFHKLETVAFSFHPEDHKPMDVVLRRLVGLQDDGTIPRTGTWELYRGLRGDPVAELGRIKRINHHVVTPGHSVEIEPPTTDLDRPAEYEGLMRYLGLQVAA